MPASPNVQQAFENAKRDFLGELSEQDSAIIGELTTIERVYEETDRIQREQEKSRSLIALGRIQPYLEALRQYSGVVETFVQVSPFFLGLIWGSMKLILQIGSTFTKSFVKIVKVITQISDHLPLFNRYTELFRTNDQIKLVSGLFYRDILDFHLTILKFFRHKGYRLLSESLWPRYASKILVINDNIDRHISLLHDAVTFTDIREAHEARERLYKEDEGRQASELNRDFEAARASILPKLYDCELETFINKKCTNTGVWMFKNDSVKEWLDTRTDSNRMLWMEGIPGAGKTMASASIIQKLSDSGENVLFVFTSFRDEKSATVLAILHSLIFQIAYLDRLFKATIVKSYNEDPRKFTSRTSYLLELLETVLESIETPFFVIDGVDEMKNVERLSLLDILAKFLRKNQRLRVLVSSRRESDISRALKRTARTIRVDHNNFEDIKLYIEEKVTTWSYKQGLEIAGVQQVKQVLEPVAGKAKGMYLYARLVIDTALACGSLSAIEQEARNLPDGLHEAYDRILKRIPGLPPAEQAQVLAIIQLIGCAISPMTTQEVEQAITIDDDSPWKPHKETFLKTVSERCGPIVEINQGIVQFVHFTAKEYIFGSQSEYFVKEKDALSAITSRSISYLRSPCLDPELPNEEIDNLILNGSYAFLTYASSYWLAHLRALCESSRIVNWMHFKRLEYLFNERQNNRFDASFNEGTVTPSWLEPFSSYNNELCRVLTHLDQYYRYERTRATIGEDKLLEQRDPLSLTFTLHRIRVRFESLLCQTDAHSIDCCCQTLKTLYGERVFRCNRLACDRFQSGFQRRIERDKHLASHDRPYKCQKSSCSYSKFGFTSAGQLRQHMKNNHKYNDNDPEPATTAIDTKQLNGQALRDVLVNAIKADNIDFVREACQYLNAYEKQELLCEAAEHSTIPMMQVLVDAGAIVRSSVPQENLFTSITSFEMYRKVSDQSSLGLPLCNAARNTNVENICFLLENGAHPCVPREGTASLPFITAIRAGNSEAVEILLQHLPHEYDSRITSSSFGYPGFFDNDDDDSRLPDQLRCIELVHKFLGQPTLRMLFGSSIRNNSRSMAALLLVLGANPNQRSSRSQTSKRSLSLLTMAVRQAKNMEQVEIIKLLLRSGADPNDTHNYIPRGRAAVTVSVKDCYEKNKKLSQLLGISWEELVNSVKDEVLDEEDGMENIQLPLRPSA